VTDFDPLRIKRDWKEHIIRENLTPLYEVDAHNIIPCWLTSEKQEYDAYTIRKKINRKLGEYLIEFPGVKSHPYGNNDVGKRLDIKKILQGIIIECVKLLADQPFLGEPGRIHKTRELVVNKTPDTLIYHVTADTISILRVFHQARKWPEKL